MPSQSSLLKARSPGAINLLAADLSVDDILSIINGGPRSAQVTLGEFLTFIGVTPFGWVTRLIQADADLPMTTTDLALLIDKTVASPTAVSLITPSLGRLALIKDMKGDANVNNITVDAGAGKLINGQQTLTLNAQWAVTLLIGKSATAWGTII